MDDKGDIDFQDLTIPSAKKLKSKGREHQPAPPMTSTGPMHVVYVIDLQTQKYDVFSIPGEIVTPLEKRNLIKCQKANINEDSDPCVMCRGLLYGKMYLTEDEMNDLIDKDCEIGKWSGYKRNDFFGGAVSYIHIIYDY